MTTMHTVMKMRLFNLLWLDFDLQPSETTGTLLLITSNTCREEELCSHIALPINSNTED